MVSSSFGLILRFAPGPRNRGPKTGGRFLYFPAPALQLMASIERHKNSVYVVPGGAFHEADGSKPLVNLKDAWARISTAAALKDVRLHDLRHSFASVAVSSGMGLPLVGALLGHRETATTARYAHLADDPLRNAANAIAGRLNHALSRPDQEPGAGGRDSTRPSDSTRRNRTN